MILNIAVLRSWNERNQNVDGSSWGMKNTSMYGGLGHYKKNWHAVLGRFGTIKALKLSNIKKE
jgi:hypothetical protein